MSTRTITQTVPFIDEKAVKNLMDSLLPGFSDMKPFVRITTIHDAEQASEHVRLNAGLGYLDSIVSAKVADTTLNGNRAWKVTLVISNNLS